MECLDTTLADFRETGDVADAGGVEAGLAEGLHGAAGGDDLPAEGHEGFGEVDDAGLVADTD